MTTNVAKLLGALIGPFEDWSGFKQEPLNGSFDLPPSDYIDWSGFESIPLDDSLDLRSNNEVDWSDFDKSDHN